MNSHREELATGDPAPAYEFDGFRLDLGRRLLISVVGNQPLAVTPRVLDTLVELVIHRGVLLDRVTLMDSVWPDADVEENNLNQNIAKLRKLLGERPGENRYIETVPGRGYRFVAAVKAVASSPQPRVTTGAIPADDEEAQRLYRQALRMLERPTADNCALAQQNLKAVLTRYNEFAPAWAFLADAYLFAVNVGQLPPKKLVDAASHAKRALELDPALAYAHAVLGTIRAQRGEWLGAESHFVTAISIDTAAVVARCLHAAFVLHQVGHVQRAVNELREAYRLLPDDPRMLMNLAISHCIVGSDAEALRYARLAVSFGFPEQVPPLPLVFAQVAVRSGDLRAAAAHAANLLPAHVDAPEVVQLVYSAVENPRLRGRATTALRGLLERSPETLLGTSGVAMLFVQWLTLLRRVDLALDVASRSIDLCVRRALWPPSWQALWLDELRPLRQDPRFPALVQRLGFPEYWAVFGPPDV